ncbi:hypothetical protein MGLY_19630 [Neomoorella glycerini]|uniref:DUF362 domain-containing protein n=1 Tax=Neomoorella glycerini TaxID=55779 RepID=A0A6I5ZSQ6_9FIRM|nr:DUF362 domain-containing protein [Moorella glycerini]QGP92577.1 hypothetical protein MGLY_19630 [Moorella glycerini]
MALKWVQTTKFDELRSFLENNLPVDELYLIKPNWFDPRPGSYTSAAVLDLVCNALSGKKIIIEGHSHSRNDLSQKITPENMDDQRDWIRTQEKLYLARTGIDEVLARHNVEYVNITEEFWAGRVVPAKIIQQHVEKKLGPLTYPEFYSFIPEKLYALRGHTLIDLAKIKMCSSTARDFSLSMKNLFGLIPYPSRLKYHTNLPQAIIDIDKLYSALFNIVAVIEGIKEAVVFWEGGQYHTPWSPFDVLKELGLLIIADNLVLADVFCGRLLGQNLLSRTLINLGQQYLGTIDNQILTKAPLLFDTSKI